MARPATSPARVAAHDRSAVLRPRALAVGAPVAPAPGRVAAAAAPVSAPTAPSAAAAAAAAGDKADKADKGERGDKTVREIIPPWHFDQVREKKAQASAAHAKDLVTDEPPPSGVRMSESPVLAAAPPAVLPVPMTPPGQLVGSPILSSIGSSGGPGAPANDGAHVLVDDSLSYKVYTLADLERRSDAPVSMRASRSSFDATSTGARAMQSWDRARAAVTAFAVATHAWLKTPKLERPDPRVALRQPFNAMGDELELVVRSFDWKKIGVSVGIAVGASLTLLFAVLTVAELTDDAKPAAGGRMRLEATGLPPTPSLVTTAGVSGASGLAQAPAALAAPVVIAPPEPAAAFDFDAPSEAPAPARGGKGAKKPGAKKNAKLSFRNADEVFKP